MKNTILIDIDQKAVTVAMTEDGRLCELNIEIETAKKIVGNIYKGKVVNVLSGMQAAFVDIGLDKNAFLYVGDALYDRGEISGGPIPEALSLKTGDEILVQVVKEGTATKGARVSVNISIPGRLLIFTPTMDFVGISNKIDDEKLKKKLHSIVEAAKKQGTGFIIRTAAAAASKKELLEEMDLLYNAYQRVIDSYKTAKSNDVIYREDDVILRSLRDILNVDTQAILINDQKVYQSVKSYLNKNMPQFERIVTLYQGADMLGEYGVNEQIDALLMRKVNLKNGSYLIIDKTEALTVIDVNTGKFTGNFSLEQTVLETNFRAAEEIARQLRLRNISGIIIIDFIDMAAEEHREKLVAHLKECLKSDRIKTNVLGMTKLGLVELTRKKIRNEVSRLMTDQCPYCSGDAYVHSARFMAKKIKLALKRLFETVDPPSVIITVSGNIFQKLFSEGHFSNECETIWKNKRIYVVPDEYMKTSVFRMSAETKAVLDLPSGAKFLY